MGVANANPYHNWPENAKRPTSLDGSLSYYPTADQFRYRENKLWERDSKRRLPGYDTSSAKGQENDAIAKLLGFGAGA